MVGSDRSPGGTTRAMWPASSRFKLAQWSAFDGHDVEKGGEGDVASIASQSCS